MSLIVLVQTSARCLRSCRLPTHAHHNHLFEDRRHSVSHGFRLNGADPGGQKRVQPVARRSAQQLEGPEIVRDLLGWEPDALTYPTKTKPTKEQLEDLRIAWLTAKHTKSNTIVLVKDRRVLGVGAGQMNRVESGLIAMKNAGEQTKGAAMASDAFFPFPDNVLNAAKAGISCIVQPGGSQKDDESIAAADENGIAMVFTGKRHFLH